ncbi:MAG: hypothetical protein HQK65_07110 [Desulfamplus sp.]|nr:hypothetical protein [Desulfamplus sp.]
MDRQDKKVLALALNISQVNRFISEASIKKKSLLILTSENLFFELNNNKIFQSSEVHFCRYSDYYINEMKKEFFTDLPLYCLRSSTDFLAFVQGSIKLFHRDVPLINLIQMEFQSNQVWPFLQRIYLTEQVLKAEQPSEVWVCYDDKWKFVILHPQSIPLTKWIDYRSGEIEIFLRVVVSQGIKVRYLKPSVTDYVRYYFSRLLRPILVRLYRQIQLAKTKIYCQLKRLSKINNDNRYPLVLAYTRSPVHSARLFPVLDELLHQSWKTCIVNDYSLAVEQKKKSFIQFPIIALAKFQRLHLYRRQFNIGSMRQWLQHNQDKLPRFFYHNIAITDIFCMILQQLTDKYLEAISFIDAFDKILQMYDATVVLVGNDMELPARCLIGLCKKLGIPTITIQHGLMSNPPLHFVPLTVDKIAVMGEQAKYLLSRFDTSPKQVQVTGVPGFDIVNRVFKKNDYLDSSLSITLITQFLPIFFQEVFPRFLQLAREMPEERFIIKVAPREPLSKYKNSVPNVEIIKDQPLEIVLKNSKIVIGINSTVLIESMQIGIPTIIIDIFFECENSMDSSAVCIKINSDWITVVQELLCDKQKRTDVINRQNKFLSYMLRRENGAAARIASLVKSLVVSK